MKFCFALQLNTIRTPIITPSNPPNSFLVLFNISIRAHHPTTTIFQHQSSISISSSHLVQHLSRLTETPRHQEIPPTAIGTSSNHRARSQGSAQEKESRISQSFSNSSKPSNHLITCIRLDEGQNRALVVQMRSIVLGPELKGRMRMKLCCSLSAVPLFSCV